MEADPNPFPRMDVLPGMEAFRKIGHLGSSVLHFLLKDDTSNISERGAGPALDRALYDEKPDNQLSFFD